MRRIFVVTALSFVFMVKNVQADAGILIEADTDTVMKIKYLGSGIDNSPILAVTGGKNYGAIVEGTWRGVTGRVPGYALPYPGLPAGVAGAGPIGMAAYASGNGGTTIGGHFMSQSGDAYGTSYGLEVVAEGGYVPIGVYAAAGGGSSGISWAAWFDGSTYSNGGTYEGSDRMLKKNIKDYSGGLAKVMALKPKSYDMKFEEFKNEMQLPKGRQIGLIAQDLQEVLPELVKDVQDPPRLTEEERKAGVKKDGQKFKAVNYTGLIPVLIAAIQEQQARIEALEARGK
jgi:hypothetical protein